MDWEKRYRVVCGEQYGINDVLEMRCRHFANMLLRFERLGSCCLDFADGLASLVFV